jgi:hypothetical protein
MWKYSAASRSVSIYVRYTIGILKRENKHAENTTVTIWAPQTTKPLLSVIAGILGRLNDNEKGKPGIGYVNASNSGVLLWCPYL